MFDRIKIKGRVTVQVFDGYGKLKRRKRGFLRRLFGLAGGLMVCEFHNIVTRGGDALIADALLAVPLRRKVAGDDGFIQVGTGWSGENVKENSGCNAPTGYAQKLDGGFPALKEAWGGGGDAGGNAGESTTVVYRATFNAGALDAQGINEACLLNGSGGDADCLAYARITPDVNVTSADTLQVLWEITILGQ